MIADFLHAETILILHLQQLGIKPGFLQLLKIWNLIAPPRNFCVVDR